MKRFTRRRFLALSAGSTASLLGWAGAAAVVAKPATRSLLASRNDDLFEQISAQAAALVEEYNLPGLSIGIVHSDQLVFARGYGFRSGLPGDTCLPMTLQTVQSMASVSKSFAGTAIMQLVEAGLMNVDLPVVEYLPYFQLADSRYSQITIRHLLGHSSGLPFARPEEEADQFAEFYNDYPYDDTSELYVKSLTDIGLLFDPGATFSYSDTGYDILADVIHKVSGQLFADYCKQHIFDPLGMTHSTFRLSEVDPDQLAQAYMLDGSGELALSPVFPYSVRHGPSSCLHSSTEDMARWIVTHFNHGKLGQSRILKTPSQKQVWEPLTPTEPGIDYAWGWFVGSLEQWLYGEPLGWPMIAAMFGGQVGVQSAFVLLPDLQLAVMAHAPMMDNWVVGFFAINVVSELMDGKCCHPVVPVGPTRLRAWRS
jgi:CubicO group peptidase (beta-lactamase class C family)